MRRGAQRRRKRLRRTFLLGKASGASECIFIGNHDHFVDHRTVEHFRDEADTDARHQVRPCVATTQHCRGSRLHLRLRTGCDLKLGDKTARQPSRQTPKLNQRRLAGGCCHVTEDHRCGPFLPPNARVQRRAALPRVRCNPLLGVKRQLTHIPIAIKVGDS